MIQLQTWDYTSTPVKGVAPSVLEDVSAKVSRGVIDIHRTGQTGTGQVRHPL